MTSDGVRCSASECRATRTPATPDPVRRGAAASVASLATVLLTVAATTGPALADDASPAPPEAVPYRPTVSSPAELSYPGWFELELGGLRTVGHHTDRRSTTPYLLKYAFDDDNGVSLGGDGLVRTSPEDGEVLFGIGDTSLTWKHRFPTGRGDEAFGLEATTLLPTARSGIGTPGLGLALNGIYSVDLGAEWHLDINTGVQRRHDADKGRQRIQGAWAAALSDALNERWSVAGEVSGSPSNSQLLGALSYRVQPRLVLDGGAARGLTTSSPKWSLFTGLTVLLGPLH